MTEADAFMMKIANTLEEHPDWLSAALQGVTVGMEMAIMKRTEMCNKMHLGLLCALAFTECLEKIQARDPAGKDGAS